MLRRAALTILVVGGLLAPIAPTVAKSTMPERGTSDDGTIVGVYPNPVTDGDRGECVVVRLPGGTDANWSLSDEEETVPLPADEAGGTIAVSEAPGLACNGTAARTIAVRDMLALSNAGETITLRVDGAVVDRVRYRDAPSAQWYRNGSWRPLGATDFEATTIPGRTGRAFVLPDSPTVPVAPLRNATDRILLAGYTFTSERVGKALRSAADRGVEVRLLLDGAPVGGLSRREADLLDELRAAGVEIRMLGGPRARYAFHHAKYAVVDDRAIVLTENWKPTGVGGRSNRGWGVVLGESTAERLARVFAADATAPDAVRWRRYRTNREFGATEDGRPSRSFPGQFPPQQVAVQRVEILVAPDNAGERLESLLRSANSSIRVVQMNVDGREDPFLQATLAAARRGVRVEILLSSAWYVREENRRLADWLRTVAAREELPLSVRLADPRSGFEKIHAKGVVIDGEVVVVGSLNWNEESWHRNREVVVAVHSREAARYFERVFRADWRGGAWHLPIGLLVCVLLVCAASVGALRRWVSFDQSP